MDPGLVPLCVGGVKPKIVGKAGRMLALYCTSETHAVNVHTPRLASPTQIA